MGYFPRVKRTVFLAAAAALLAIIPVFGQGDIPKPPLLKESICPDPTPAVVVKCGREQAQTFRAPRTADGKPDLSGYWTQSQAPHESIEAHPRTPDDNGWPTAIVDPPDGKAPIQPWAEEKRKEIVAKYIDQNAQCFESGVPRHLYMGQYQFVQTATHFAFLSEETNAVRLVTMDARPHVGRNILLWQGDSRGRWEGDTLVVDTTNHNGLPRLDQRGRFFTDAMVATERFTMFERNSILWEVTLNDPLVYTRPFTMAGVLRRIIRPGFEIWEESCYEGEANTEHLRNIGFRNFPGISSAQAKAFKDEYDRRNKR
jgi:hypothetical protein